MSLSRESKCLACTGPKFTSQSLHEPGVVTNTCNANTEEMKAGRLEVQDHRQAHIDLEGGLWYLRPCLKTKQTNKAKYEADIIKTIWQVGK